MRPAIRSLMLRLPWDGYAHSTLGSNSNDGRTPGRPVQTLAKLMSLPGRRFCLMGGSEWEEALVPTRHGLTIGTDAAGLISKPRLLGSSSISTNSWSSVTGDEYSTPSALSFADTHIFMESGGSVTALAKGTAGSLTAGQYAFSGGTLRVNKGGGAPTTAQTFRVPWRTPVYLNGIHDTKLLGLFIAYSENYGVQLSDSLAVDGTVQIGCEYCWCMADLVNGFLLSTRNLIADFYAHDTVNTKGDAFSFHGAGSGTIANGTIRRIRKNGITNAEPGSWLYKGLLLDGANMAVYAEAGAAGTHVLQGLRLVNVKPGQIAGEPFLYLASGGGLQQAGTTITVDGISIALGAFPNDGGSSNVRGIRFDGGGIVTVRNAALWGTATNTHVADAVTKMSIGLYKSAGSFALESHNAAGGSTADRSGWGTNNAVNLAADPYTDVSGQDLAPGVGSPLAGAGLAVAGVTGATPDIGYTAVP